MYMIVFLLITLARTVLEMWLWHPPLLDAIVESLLVVQVGLAGLYAFFSHYFVPDKAFEYLGRPTDDPLRQKVGIAHLALGVLGILCCWLHGSFWLATGIAAIIFWSGAAITHIGDLMKRRTFHSGNAGALLLSDIGMPVLLLGLLGAYVIRG